MGVLVSRRALLGGGITIAVAWAAWRLLPLGAGELDPRPLDTLERAVVAALLVAMFPTHVLKVDPMEIGAVEEVDRLLQEHFLPSQAVALRALLKTLQLGTRIGRGRSFTDLSVTERQDVLDEWARPEVSLRRLGFESIRVLLSMAYFNAPDVTRALDYRPTCGSRT